MADASDPKDRPERKWGEEYNFHKGDDAYGFWWLNAKADFHDYRQAVKDAQGRSQTHFDNLASAHTDLVRKLNDQYVTHAANLNKKTLEGFSQHSEHMRHLLNRFANMDIEEAVASDKILNEPFIAAVKAAVADAVLSAVGSGSGGAAK